MKYLVTGGAGFIGSAAVRHLVKAGHHVLNIDKLTYAGDPRTIADVADAPGYTFLRADIADAGAMGRAFMDFAPDVVLHLAAESHVDRSIDGPGAFIDTNIRGTFVLLDAALKYWKSLPPEAQERFRFLTVSTDEVYGSLGPSGSFSETTPYQPNSPYAASKASADHLTRAWCETFDLPTIITNCSNNYGPFQNGEKFLPTIIRNALIDRPIPIYGRGENVRDWLYVDDHVSALITIANNGKVGEKYNVGGNAEVSNLDLANTICTILDEMRPRADGKPYAEQLRFTKDRPGHDFRYAIDATKIKADLGWEPSLTFTQGMRKMVKWYLDNQSWWREGAENIKRLGLGEEKQ
ncbi:MAG: dTDP-glucose 4,6-dehydratase [Robiginitomaculum sp.]|nr:dTDP-glucose 4,6-dehydratase [Robiginitomaculum sp.]MDQ7076363.1 dTDP-glucose 4,6-dehydratase [Robiginitomaculum sp.]